MKDDLTNHNKPKKESMWLNLGFNLIIPILFLRKGDEWFGPSLENILDSPKDGTLVGSVMLLLAISFPIGYGAWDFYQKEKMELSFNSRCLECLSYRRNWTSSGCHGFDVCN